MANNLSVELSADSSKLQKAIKNAKDTLSKYKEETQNTVGVTNAQLNSLNRITNAMSKATDGTKTAAASQKQLKKEVQELQIMWNGMSNTMRNSDFGKAVSDTIKSANKELKLMETNIKSAKGTIDKSNGSIKDMGNLTDILGSKLGLIKNLASPASAALAAIGVSAKVAKDALFATQAGIDDWGRTMEAAESTYTSFLYSLNNGDISGFLARIGQIQQAARNAYDEIDRLGTMKILDNPRMSAQNAENERMRAMLRSGRYIAPTDGRKATMADGAKLSPDQMKNISKHLENGEKTLININRQQVTQNNKAIAAQKKLVSKETGISERDIDLILKNGIQSYDQLQNGYEKYKQYEKEHTKYRSDALGNAYAVRDDTKNPYQQYKNVGNFNEEGKSWTKLMSLYADREAQISKVYQDQAATFKTLNKADKAINGGSKTSAKPKTTTKETFDKNKVKFKPIVDIDVIEAEEALYDKAHEEGFDTLPLVVEADLTVADITGVEHITDIVGDDTLKSINDYEEALNKAYETLNKLTLGSIEYENQQQRINQLETELAQKTETKGEQYEKLANKVGVFANSFSAFGEAFELPALDAAGIMAGAIASIIQGYATASAQASSMGPWAWIGFALSGAATLASIIPQVNSLGSYADGGIIQGSSTLGDHNVAMVNKGEMILNGTQQKRLFRMLNMSGGGNDNINPTREFEFKIKGSNLIGVERNYVKKHSRL